MKVVQVNTVKGCVDLHTRFVSQFVTDAWNSLITTGVFRFHSRISSDRNGWVSSIGYNDSKYVGTGKEVSNAVYSELVMPCDWLALAWQNKGLVKLQMIRESDSGYITVLTLRQKDEQVIRVAVAKALEDCETMCKDHRKEVQTQVFG